MESDGEVPETLYHYTSQAGMLGILGSRELFATKAQYMNDSSEFSLALDIGRREATQLNLHARVLSYLDSLRSANIFVISLTEEGDLLSQWRAYGKPGSAFSIGFDSEILRELAEQWNWSFVECEYDPDTQVALIQDLLQAAKVALKTGTLAEDNFVSEVFAVSAKLKHPSFVEEQEWRLVSPVLSEVASPPRFRLGRHTPIPYITFPLSTPDFRLAVKEVVVGPNRYPAECLRAVASFLRTEQVLVPVRLSKSTLRDW